MPGAEIVHSSVHRADKLTKPLFSFSGDAAEEEYAETEIVW